MVVLIIMSQVSKHPMNPKIEEKVYNVFISSVKNTKSSTLNFNVIPEWNIHACFKQSALYKHFQRTLQNVKKRSVFGKVLQRSLSISYYSKGHKLLYRWLCPLHIVTDMFYIKIMSVTIFQTSLYEVNRHSKNTRKAKLFGVPKMPNIFEHGGIFSV